MILRKQKNQLLGLIQECGLDPGLFTATDDVEIGGGKYFVVSLRGSPVSFAVRPYEGSFETTYYRYSTFREGFPLCADRVAPDWRATLVERFKVWLEEVVRPYLDDMAIPDMWEILERTSSQTRTAVGTPEEFGHFTDEEKLRIRLSINEFRLVVVNSFGPNEGQMKAIDDRLEYLSEALDKHNRFDWKGIAIQTAIAIVVALSLDTDQGAKLFHLFARVFSNMLYLLR